LKNRKIKTPKRGGALIKFLKHFRAGELKAFRLICQLEAPLSMDKSKLMKAAREFGGVRTKNFFEGLFK